MDGRRARIVIRSAGGISLSMRYVISVLALLGVVVSILAWQIHYSNAVQPCDINARWDCGVVNHSRFSMVGPVPVAAIGVAGYVLLIILAFLRRRRLTLIASVIGLAYALYLSSIEDRLLQVWCLYCVSSQILIAAITVLAILWVIFGKSRPKIVPETA